MQGTEVVLRSQHSKGSTVPFRETIGLCLMSPEYHWTLMLHSPLHLRYLEMQTHYTWCTLMYL